MVKRMLTLSLIIPVYNEERHIEACLEAVKNQIVMPDEVILVDNNCSDATVAMAKKYSFVTVVRESRQGRGYARSAGFNAARCDIIGRIDADAVIDKDWVRIVKQRFSHDEELMGLTGIGMTAVLPFSSKLKSTLWSRCYFWFVHAGFGVVTMWGANMAVRRSAWNKVESKVLLDDSVVHEDQDLSLWIASESGKIVQDSELRVTTSGQTYRYLPKSIRYLKLYLKTKRIHAKNGNLKTATYRLSFSKTIAGRVVAMFLGCVFIAVNTVLFPLDYVMVTSVKYKNWVD